jgi:hypothetical protein
MAAAASWSPVTLLLWASGCVFAGVACGIDGWGDNLAVGLSFLMIAAVLGALGMARSGRGSGTAPVAGSARKYWLVLGALLLAHTLGAVLYGWKVPAVDIDCYTFQQVSEHRLMQGTDPFGQTQANIYTAADTPHYYGPGMVVDSRVQVGLQYPPITLAWILPGYLVGDIRYSYILAVVLSAVAIFALSPGRRNLYMAAFLLLNPITFLVENRCWTEPMVLLALCATVFVSRVSRGWLPLALGLLLATKQYNFLLLPFVPYLVVPFRWRPYARLMAVSICVALATVAPFAVWNFRAVIRDLVLFHLAQPFRTDSLSFAVLSPVFQWLGPLLLAAMVAWILLRVRAKEAIFAAAYGVCLLIFVATSKQAFCNYYFLAGDALLLAAAALPPGIGRFKATEVRGAIA